MVDLTGVGVFVLIELAVHRRLTGVLKLNAVVKHGDGLIAVAAVEHPPALPKLIDRALRQLSSRSSLQEAFLCAGTHHAVLILQRIEHQLQLHRIFCNETGASRAVLRVAQQPEDLIRTVLPAADQEMR